MSGINSSSYAFETKVTNKASSVTYYYTNNTFYRGEYPTVETNGSSVICTFDSFKNVPDGYVWAKNGYVTVTIEPAVSGGTTFAAARARGQYAHSTTSSGSIGIDVTFNSVGKPTFTITHSKGDSKVVGMKNLQMLFYNDGSKVKE